MNEKELFRTNPAMFRNHPIWFITFVLLVLAGMAIPIFLRDIGWIIGSSLAVLGGLSLMVWWINNIFIILTITEKRVIFQKGFIARSISEVYHVNVRNIVVEQSIIQRIFNVGTFRVASAAHTSEIEVKGIKNPMHLRDLINEQRAILKSNGGQNDD